MGHLGSAAHHAAAAAAAASSLQFFYQGGGDPHLGQPPPAHMGIPPYQLDPKTAGAMGKTSFFLFSIHLNVQLDHTRCVGFQLK